MQTKLLVIGQAPSRNGDQRAALQGRLGAKLATLFGCTIDDYLAQTQRFNVVPRYPGKNGKGDTFPLALARRNASRMRYSFGGCRILFVGIATAGVFDVTHPPLIWKRYKISETNEDVFHAAILPHPSGVNFWWNDPVNVILAGQFMRRVWRLTK